MTLGIIAAKAQEKSPRAKVVAPERRPTSTQGRYFIALSEMYSQSGTFSAAKILKHHSVSGTLTTVLKKMGIVTTGKAGTRWVGSKPTPEMATRVIQRVNDYVNGSARKSKTPKPVPEVRFTEQDAVKLLKASEEWDYEITRSKTIKEVL